MNLLILPSSSRRRLVIVAAAASLFAVGLSEVVTAHTVVTETNTLDGTDTGTVTVQASANVHADDADGGSPPTVLVLPTCTSDRTTMADATYTCGSVESFVVDVGAVLGNQAHDATITTAVCTCTAISSDKNNADNNMNDNNNNNNSSSSSSTDSATATETPAVATGGVWRGGHVGAVIMTNSSGSPWLSLSTASSSASAGAGANASANVDAGTIANANGSATNATVNQTLTKGGVKDAPSPSLAPSSFDLALHAAGALVLAVAFAVLLAL